MNEVIESELLPTRDIIRKVMDSIAAVDSELATQEDCLIAMNFAARLREIAKDLSAQVEANVIAWIEEHGPIIDGTVKYYVGPNKTTKCLDVKAAVEELMTATMGDYDAFVSCLSSGALKHGACSKVLPPEQYERLFQTVEVADLKTGVAKGEKLQKIDTQFLK